VIVPWAASRSVVSWGDGAPGSRGAKALNRWSSTAREAAKQSRRLRFPLIEALSSTEHVTAILQAASTAVVLHATAETPVAELDVSAEGDLVAIVGPEGGLTDDELDAFTRAGARPVRLGPSVLRASAAGAIAAGVLLSRSPRWT
jgi:16S rRNA (uracil1498-N3)-methyltransferase